MRKREVARLRRMAEQAIEHEESAKARSAEKWKDHPGLVAEDAERADRWITYYRNQIAILDFMAEYGRLPRRSEVAQQPIP